MYTPAHFRVDDERVLADFLRAYSFGTLVTVEGQQAHATHVPMLLRGAASAGGHLLFHLARANPQWRHLTAGEALCIFTGPHTYISPTLYAPGENVPTWNYTSVHIYGKARVIDQPEELDRMLFDLVEHYESARANPWVDTNSKEYRERMLKAIVGIEVTISRIEGKFKLSQNRPDEIARVIEGLSQSTNSDDLAVADFMQRFIGSETPP